MRGYLIVNSKGQYLTQGKWYHERMSTAKVFAAEETLAILTEAIRDHWRNIPATIVPATWTEEKGICVVGEPRPVRVRQRDFSRLKK